MENVSEIYRNLVLLGIVEIEPLQYLYAMIAIIIYVSTMMLSSMIVYIIWSEETLHEPMYIFIGNLVVNVIFGNSAIVPKMVIDLLFGLNTISLPGCLIQAFCYQSFGVLELFAFTVMAYDRYLAVRDPLRYPTLMTNRRAFWILFAALVFVSLSIGITVALAARLSMCGEYINNMFCETMSLLRLACGDTTINNVYGTIWTMTVLTSCLLVVIYCYIRTFLVCLNVSVEAYQKGIYTLITHIVSFSSFEAASLFVIFRYRLGSGSLSTLSHVFISITGVIVSITLNPLIYGIRTEALRIKLIANKMYLWRSIVITK
ncbi:olfactory receptor 1020-like [Hyla sarda]|uniref:olfactory receptor 1020-like n=1 Tax=Hyla sarda TaxID=327740 RepID=UPI0024C2E9ED|nr:olfactory receptor 1020-like [Hyla sarda]